MRHFWTPERRPNSAGGRADRGSSDAFPREFFLLSTSIKEACISILYTHQNIAATNNNKNNNKNNNNSMHSAKWQGLWQRSATAVRQWLHELHQDQPMRRLHLKKSPPQRSPPPISLAETKAMLLQVCVHVRRSALAKARQSAHHLRGKPPPPPILTQLKHS